MLEEIVRDIFQILIQRRVITLDPEISALASAVEDHVAAAGGTPTPGAATPQGTLADPTPASDTPADEAATPPVAPESA